MRLPAALCCLVALLALVPPVAAQETERLGAPPIVWGVPHLQLLSDGDTELFRGLDATLALPLTPRSNVTATYSYDVDDDDTATATFNYDYPLKRNTVLRGLVGVIRDDFGYGLTLHRAYKEYGVGVFGQNVDGSFEGGVMITRQVPWGFKLGDMPRPKRQESSNWASGAGRNVGDLGARAALMYRGGGEVDELFTTTAYFPTYRQSWPREGQSVQGVSYTSTEFAPPAKPAWQYQTEGPVRASAAIVDGVAYIGSYDGWLYALDLALGRKLWRFPAEAPITGAPAWAEGRLYLGTEAGDVFCVAPSRKDGPPTGQLVWRYRTSSAVTASPLVTDSGLVIVGSCDGYIYGLDRAGGRLVWKISTGGPVLASASKMARDIPAGVDNAGTPTIRSGGVLVGSSDGKLYAIEEVKGQVIWTFATDGPITAATATVNNRLFVVNRGGSVYALDGATGKQLWANKITGSIAYSPAVDEKSAYVATTEGVLYALDAQTGRTMWQTDLAAAVAASPTLVRGQLMYAVSRDGRLWTVDRTSGKVVGVHRESQPLMTCAAIADGHLLVGGDSGTVFAYVPGGGSLPLAPAETASLPQPVVPTEPKAPVTTPPTPATPPTPTVAKPPTPPAVPAAPSTPASAAPATAPVATAPKPPVVAPVQPTVTPPSTAATAPVATPAAKPTTVAIKPPEAFPSPVTPPGTPTVETKPTPVVEPTTPAVTPPTTQPPTVPVKPVSPPVEKPAAPTKPATPGTATLAPATPTAPAAAAPAQPAGPTTPTPTTVAPPATTQPPTPTPVVASGGAQAPLLTLLLAPMDGRTPLLLTNQNYLFVGGKVAPTAGIVAVRVNGLETPIKNGEYSTQVTFPGPGDYLLLVEAVSRDGNTTSHRRSIKVLQGVEAASPDKLSFRLRGGSPIVSISPGLRALQAIRYRKTLEVRDAQGKVVNSWTTSGSDTGDMTWNGTDANGAAVAPGDYELLYQLVGDNGPVAWIRQKLEIQE